MIRVLVLALAAAPVFAHMMSMSTGDIRIEGTKARYELRMPIYEIAHVKDPSEALFRSIRFSSGGKAAALQEHSCREDKSLGAYVCTAEYGFAAPVDTLDVECTFYSVTVPNHVHLLHAEMDGRRDQGLFDISFSKASLRFRPPSAAETVVTQGGAGFMRALGGAVQILFLTALVLAARSRRELMALAGMFLAGQLAAVVIVPLTSWQPASRFVEAAAALTIAYLAVEILLLPQAGSRWLIAGVLGGFHGLYFHLFLQNSGYRPELVMAGAAAAELLAIGLLGWILSRAARLAHAFRPVQVSASVLLVFGMAWFLLRLRG